MQKQSFFKKNLLIVAIFLPFIFMGCISNTGNTFTSRLQVGVQVTNLDSTLTAGPDSMQITSIRLILSDSFFAANEDSLQFITQPGMIAFDTADPQFANPRLLGSGVFPEGVYQKLQIKIPRAPEDLSDGINIDSDFKDDDGRYSIIAEGTYNGTSFTYKSKQVITPILTFAPPLDVPEQNKQYAFLLKTDLSTWFANPGQGLLDPTVEENSSEIDNNISQSFGYEQSQQ